MSVVTTSQRELDAMISLLDDSDTEVVAIVESKLKSLGKEYITALENSLHQCPNFLVQSKIEEIIIDINSIELKDNLSKWLLYEADLLEAAFYISKFETNSHTDFKHYTQKVDRLTRSVWLEMTNYLTPLERIKLVENIIYNIHRLKGNRNSYHRINDFLITEVIEKLSGNGITNAILYLTLASTLDLPVRAFKYNDTIILAWYSHEFLFDIETNTKAKNFNNIKIFIDPLTGKGFSHLDMNYLLTVSDLKFNDAFFKPLTNKEVIHVLVREYAKCFEKHFPHKYAALNQIILELFS